VSVNNTSLVENQPH